MARTYLGAVVEMLRREFTSKFHRDLVLELETGPATPEQLRRISDDLSREFPKMTGFSAGGDADQSWRISVRVRPSGPADSLRQDLSKWASRNEPFVRKYSVRQRSLWAHCLTNVAADKHFWIRGACTLSDVLEV
jgi:hypothetical protein